MKINTKKVVVGMPPEIYAALEKLAGKKRHTVPSYIRWLIWQHIDEKSIPVTVFGKKPSPSGEGGIAAGDGG